MRRAGAYEGTPTVERGVLVPDAELPAADGGWRDSGDRLVFRVSALGDRDRLHIAIAKVLAQVYRLATGAHWRLANEMEEPFREWVAKNPSATESRRQDKWHASDAEYMRRFREEIAAILERWGMVDSVSKDTGN